MMLAARPPRVRIQPSTRIRDAVTGEYKPPGSEAAFSTPLSLSKKISHRIVCGHAISRPAKRRTISLSRAPRNLGATTRGAPAIWTQISNAPIAIRSFEGLPDGAAPGTAAARIQVSCALLEVARLLGVPPSEALAILGQA